MIISHRYAVAAAFHKYFLSQCFEFPSLVTTSPYAQNFQEAPFNMLYWLSVRFSWWPSQNHPLSLSSSSGKCILEMSRIHSLGLLSPDRPLVHTRWKSFSQSRTGHAVGLMAVESLSEGKPAGLALVSELKNSLGYSLPRVHHALIFLQVNLKSQAQ